jgi:NAD(P)-dependent dehydrogenase (short-subunit alcohol dehydrogenase family)
MPATVVVVDGMGGGIGAQIVERLKREGPPGLTIVALGTNAQATQRMLEAGADRGASGENAIRVSVGMGDYVIGPLGIVLPNAMMGEVSPAIAEAVMASRGRKILLPLSQPHAIIVGLASANVSQLIDQAVVELAALAGAGR